MPTCTIFSFRRLQDRTWFRRHVPFHLTSVKTPILSLYLFMTLTAPLMWYIAVTPITYLRMPEPKGHSHALFASPNNGSVAKDLLRIMLWTRSSPIWILQLNDSRNTEIVLKDCPAECLVTNDRRLIEYTDAVVFHTRTLDMADLPPKRFSWQKWVFFVLESPPHTRFTDFHITYHMFNWTMTYRRDSDVYAPYGRIVPRDAFTTTTKRDLRALWKSKNKTAVWMVSNCRTIGRREYYVAKLRRYVDVDTYGRCGQHRCPKSRGDSCYADLERTYFYILAFENSICVEYVTEKLYNALRHDIIPVVFGGANYSQVAPRNSYIDALSFKSPRHLAKYLIKLSKNYTEYAAYYTWKDHYYVPPSPEPYCELCKKLQSRAELQRTSSYGDLKSWWFDKANCRSWYGRKVSRPNSTAVKRKKSMSRRKLITRR
ncbi:alpha-(1,3)-fucosyltransferase C-like [Dermacentor silvarum]|uniref:alpha-(1,3)-fucosyltransferase C-like n=1 Tax=Dermacentor silvarum TaxID=543639 RepID=UPI002100F335|nr:alpha-(1,3)-fucosyltransferase C-like [Dermacentor silvarum]